MHPVRRPPRRRATVAAAAAVVALAAVSGCSSDDTEPGGTGVSASGSPSASDGPASGSPSTGAVGANGDVSEGAGSRDGDLPGRPDQAQGNLLGQFVNFALRPDPRSARTVDFAERVEIGVGSEVRSTLSGSDLGNPRRWKVPVDGAIEGVDGRVSALESVTGQAERAVETQQTEGIFVVTAGEHDRCSASPGPPLDGYTAEQQISVMPGARSIQSCLQWFAVDLYTDDAGDIAAVRLDLYVP